MKIAALPLILHYSYFLKNSKIFKIRNFYLKTYNFTPPLIGMDQKHSQMKMFSLVEHAEEQKRVHRELINHQRRLAKYQSSTSDSDDSEEVSDVSDSELEADSCYFLQPVPIRQRRALLRASGVQKIESFEKEECRDIR